MVTVERFIKLKNNFFYNIDDINSDISDFIGNKSFHTFLLASKGFVVPKSIFITTDLFDCYFADIISFDKIISEIQYYLYSSHFSNSLAIRSSALLFDHRGNIIKEDSYKISMAGWFKSNLNISINNIRKAIIDCYSIIESDVLKLNIRNNFNNDLEIKIALLIQDFYEAEKSAVVFTKNPFSYNKGDFLINSTYGACMGLVSGTITGDTYWVNRNDLSVKMKHISTKTKMYINNLESLLLVDVPLKIQNKESLSCNDISILYNLGMSLEDNFKCSQDIELIYHVDHGWIVVQTRPVNYWREQ